MSNTFSGQNIKGRLDIFEATASFARPANTTAYASGDSVSDNTSAGSATNFEFTGAALGNGESFRLDYVSLTSDNAVTGVPFELWLYSANPTALADNAAFTISDAENDTVLSVISISTAFSSAVNWRIEAGAINRIIKLGTNTSSIFGNLKIAAVYTPASGETLTARIVGTYL